MPDEQVVDLALLSGDDRVDDVVGVGGSRLAVDVVDLVADADVEQVAGLDVIGIADGVLGLQIAIRHCGVRHRLGNQVERVAGLDLVAAVRRPED